MRSLTGGRCRSQISFLRQQFLQGGGLPSGDAPSKKIVSQAITSSGVVWKERIYSPLVTLWVFLGQVLSADHSCRSAVARLIAHRLAQGDGERRLQEKLYSAMSCLVGRELDTEASS